MTVRMGMFALLGGVAVGAAVMLGLAFQQKTTKESGSTSQATSSRAGSDADAKKKAEDEQRMIKEIYEQLYEARLSDDRKRILAEGLHKRFGDSARGAVIVLMSIQDEERHALDHLFDSNKEFQAYLAPLIVVHNIGQEYMDVYLAARHAVQMASKK